MAILEINRLTVTRSGQAVVRDISLELHSGDLVVIEGKNGAGKSSLLLTIMGHPSCVVTAGDVRWNGESLLDVPVYQRARKGLFLAHQEPVAIGGVTLSGVVRAALEARDGTVNIPEAQARIRNALATVGMDDAFATRFLNVDFSGGEKKKAELVQMMLLEPQVCLLDEIDSGLDEQARGVVAEVIAALREKGTAFLLVTHSPAFANALHPTARLAL